uniref:Chromo domain-containing protein n=1 Tax=Chromera velia CCMP2878 TaxID=1169474 RepID=A0A0G4H9S1_9ALVE|mmetsp:Transcript_29035/g.56867  ORF Transcript_29035/g.56867 Transcript_29035/m.56867 type:complete len:377 (+) Transcript_29035:134-1264(+)|eukprot:Cvel_25465.t1-p1 / transcript=Cvel_25465.t1 / gene=Cvel_25465 / organism=Chromera_velia_CCMP2878 / gene_product=Methylsterol monooxygenase 2-2, putative / transcript_product=Methylsterol monooxygenase 2-2, putative / location=Cvel_scaffold2889:12680-14133(+) / protein_length=376 / sequence_SO=supercontig / SO=protein_coding / is_pseudo=false
MGGGLEGFLTVWLRTPMLCWGLGPVLVANIAVFSSILILEPLIWSGLLDKHMISHTGENRKEALKKIRETFPFTQQLAGTIFTLAGPSGVLNSVLSALILPWIHPLTSDDPQIPPVWPFLRDLLLLLLLGDLALYWGHRIQHESTFLWETAHKYHHAVLTPSPVSAAFINHVDAALQAGLPVLFASAIVKPHPLTFYAFVFLKIRDNVVNHAGIDHWLVNLLFLKYFPFRGTVVHHDSHHKFCNYAQGVRNLGEFFWIWDWVFGTLSTSAGVAKRLGQHKAKKEGNSGGDGKENEQEQEEEEWEVERIRAFEWRGARKEKKRYFHIKWKGFPEGDNTWEPEENLENARAILEAFIEKHPEAQAPFTPKVTPERKRK